MVDFKPAIDSITSNKLRSLLTILGVVIGVWAVILLVAIGNGIRVYLGNELTQLGSNLIFIMPGAVFKEGNWRTSGEFGMLTGARFDQKDVNKIAKLEGVKAVAPLVVKTQVIGFGSKQVVAEVVGTTTTLAEIRQLQPTLGRFFTKAEERRGKRVVVLGHQIAKDLFGNTNPLGKRIKINRLSFVVIGVAPKKGGAAGSLGPALDQRVYLPYRAIWRLTGEKKFIFLLAEAESNQAIGALKTRLKTLLGQRYKKDEFSVVDQTEILKVLNNVLGVVTLALAGIAGIALIVGGVGILNIMYVVVAERTREIGLRKAVGATNNDIRNQFLIESAILALLGGAVGSILGLVSALILQVVFPASPTWWSFLLAFGVCFLLGIFFGLAPARKAAKLSPVEALRYE